ncbi:ribokinase, partial [Candidatus Bipolaricaulota bacterium]|nr:ribokinase [Candidatus Bipolaricaulota bacterium]
MGAKIAVFGSVNMDLVARVERFPRPGETIRGLSFARIPGGKGANQAVAAAKLGGEVSFYGLVGDDGIATDLSHNLR